MVMQLIFLNLEYHITALRIIHFDIRYIFVRLVTVV